MKYYINILVKPKNFMIIRKNLIITIKFFYRLFTYANPANVPILNIKNDTIYAVTKVIAHIVNAHL